MNNENKLENENEKTKENKESKNESKNENINDYKITITKDNQKNPINPKIIGSINVDNSNKQNAKINDSSTYLLQETNTLNVLSKDYSNIQKKIPFSNQSKLIDKYSYHSYKKLIGFAAFKFLNSRSLLFL